MFKLLWYIHAEYDWANKFNAKVKHILSLFENIEYMHAKLIRYAVNNKKNQNWAFLMMLPGQVIMMIFLNKPKWNFLLCYLTTKTKIWWFGLGVWVSFKHFGTQHESSLFIFAIVEHFE